MQENSTLTVFWLMDAFGHILHYDKVRDVIFRRPFKAFNYPSLTLLLPTPFIFPLPARFQISEDTLRTLPPLEFIPDPQTNAVGLYHRNKNQWLSIDPHTEMTHTHAPYLGAHEKFLLLDLTLLKGLSQLIKPQNIHITSTKLPNINPNTPLTFNKDGNHHALFHNFPFDLKKNFQLLREVGSIEPKETKSILVKGNDFNLLPITVERK